MSEQESLRHRDYSGKHAKHLTRMSLVGQPVDALVVMAPTIIGVAVCAALSILMPALAFVREMLR